MRIATTVAAGLFVLCLQIGIANARGPQATENWSLTIQGAAGLPQDVWIAATGNNTDGWKSGGSICLGGLAQGLEFGQSITILTDVLTGGVFGVDGQPVEAGDYVAPGVDLPARAFTITNGESFFVTIDGFVVESTEPDFLPAGIHVPLMFTFQYVEGRFEQELVGWMKDAVTGDWFPFLNEGLMMTNVRAIR